MDPTAKVPDALACPRCRGKLALHATDALQCERCGRSFPVVGGVPCLIEDPELWRTVWLRRVDDYATSVELRIASLRGEVEASDMLERTKRRLLAIAAGFERQLEVVTALFEALDRENADDLVAAAIPSRPEPGVEAAVLECYEHLFRDWIWGQAESARAVESIKELLPAGLDQIAVYGAGAGRLAVDVHQACGPNTTFAPDVNPLPYLVLAQLLAGHTVQLPEFPIDPRSDDVVVLDRTLTLPFPVRPGFTLLFSDALRPAFADGSLDAVVTSWFIDVARADLRQTAAAINRVLRPGGVWVNLGPLRFQSVAARAYCIEEVMEIVGAAGFEAGPHDASDVPYFHAPASGSRRIDTVFRFAARKTGEVAPVEIADPVPPWVANPLLPIPITQAMIAIARTSMFTSGVLSMIDGRRSIVEVARELGAAWGVEPSQLHEELRAFLAKLPAA